MHELFICEAHLGDSMRYFGIVKNSIVCISIFIGLRWKNICKKFVIGA
jgi:formate/nitrite transporter FocA (FNT family)